MDSFSTLIGAIGGKVLADELGVRYPTVASWKRRNFLPFGYWDATLVAADSRGIAVTKTDLLRIAEVRDRAARTDEAA